MEVLSRSIYGPSKDANRGLVAKKRVESIQTSKKSRRSDELPLTILSSLQDEEVSKLFREDLDLGNAGGVAKEQSGSDVSAEKRALVTSRAWSLSTQPAKALFMNVFMIWMMGGGGMFGIIIVGYALITAIRTLLGCQKVFEDLSKATGVQENFYLQKAVYCVIAMAFVLYLLYSCAKMGFLPLSTVTLTDPIVYSNKPIPLVS